MIRLQARTLAFALLLTLLLSPVLPAAAQKIVETNAAEDLTSFLPIPESVFLQRTDEFPGIGNVKVLVHLSSSEIGRLAKATGHQDFLVFGSEGDQTLLRDDGVGADDVAGDGVFTGVGTADEADLIERSATDTNRTASGQEVPVFDGRVLVGSEAPRGFDANAFEDGGVVELTPPVETLSTQTVGTSTANSSVSLVATDGEKIRAQAAAAVVPGTNAFQDQVLMIKDPSVVADPTRTFDVCTGAGNPNGVWTFNNLMTQMANPAASGINPSTFVEDWLKHWLTAQTINSDNVPARLQMQSLINQWKAASGGTSLDLRIAPVRLLAIVSRLDLATTRGGGSGYVSSTGDFLDAGEARFIFGVVLPPGYSSAGFFDPVPLGGGCRALRFSIILEYRVPRCHCKEVRTWAKQWVSLAGLPFPSPTYNKRLEALTRQFITANSNPLKPNGSAIGQVRTNEIAINQPFGFWELREFQLPQKQFSFLAETTVADNPISTFNNTPTFSSWVLGPVLTAVSTIPPTPIPKVPLFFLGAPFLGGHAPVLTGFWNGPGIDGTDPLQNEARFESSLATCESCHRQETLTQFVQVDPATPGLPANLSGFLTGIANVPDAAFGMPLRSFDDLARREIDIKKKARMICFRFHPINLALVRSSLAQLRRLPPDPFQGLEPLPLEEQISVAEEALIGKPVTQVH